MDASRMVVELSKNFPATMHAGRRESLTAAVFSALDGAALTVTALGRGLGGGAYEKHRIKRVDRLLSNRMLESERHGIYMLLASRLTAGMTRPVIHVDWSNLDRGKRRFLLRAALAVKGRALTLYEEVHPRERFMKARVERRFLACLGQVLAPQCRHIIATDAGFLNPWRRTVLALGWDFVCRVRGRVMLADPHGEHWQQARGVFEQARAHPRALTQTRLSRNNPLTCHLILARQRRCRRHHRDCYGRRVRGHYSNKKARGQREPWLLATSLKVADAGGLRRIVKLYQTRMQIEEAFRDLKSPAIGLGLAQARSKRLERIENLLLIALLAMYLAWIIGLCVTQAGLHRRYQANTLTKRAVLSAV